MCGHDRPGRSKAPDRNPCKVGEKERHSLRQLLLSDIAVYQGLSFKLFIR
jgi:hypothetical protein